METGEGKVGHEWKKNKKLQNSGCDFVLFKAIRLPKIDF